MNYCPGCGRADMAGITHICPPTEIIGWSVNPLPPDDRALQEAFAVAMHALTCGSWEAAGFETQERFRAAAAAALMELKRQGLDLLDLLPLAARGQMPW